MMNFNRDFHSSESFTFIVLLTEILDFSTDGILLTSFSNQKVCIFQPLLTIFPVDVNY